MRIAMTEPVAPSSTTPALPPRTLVARGAALLHLGFMGAGEVTRLTAEMHATIRRFPLPWKPEATASSTQAPLPYQIVLQAFRHLARLTSNFVDAREPAVHGRQWGLFRSILNGVAGDAVRDWESPLQQPMMLCNEHGEALPPQAWREQGERGAVLFVHGLCLSDREWQSEAHREFVRDLRAAGLSVAWLRYNTGRPIHENGSALSLLLERTALDARTPLTLIGHSMGGLVIRSATHHGHTGALRWVSRLQQAAYLGSPHLGAPLEQLGNRANRLLALTPYTRPLMQIGNLRSHGIMNLRQGQIVPPGDTAPTTLHTDARHLLLAGHLGRDQQRHWLGDGLVPVRSALGQHVESDRALSGQDVTRVELHAIGHMGLLKDERVYTALREWMQFA